jgi:hypothetical protein
VPATTDDLIALAPSVIYLGHGHFDHALEAPRIAAATGAVIVGTQEHCDQAVAAVDAAIDCRALFQAGAAPGAVATIDDLLAGVCTTAVLHLHSAAEPPDPDHDHTNQVVPIPDPGSVLLHPPGSLFGTEGDEGGTVLYQFRVGDFALTWHDSSGPMKENNPEVFDVLAALPATDVQVGAILGFNQITNGLRDPAMYIDALAPAVFVPNHHDFITEYGSANDFEPVLRATLADYDADPEIRFLYDPYDYVRPNLLSYRVDDARWAGPADARCAAAGRAARGAGRAAAGPAAVERLLRPTPRRRPRRRPGPRSAGRCSQVRRCPSPAPGSGRRSGWSHSAGCWGAGSGGSGAGRWVPKPSHPPVLGNAPLPPVPKPSHPPGSVQPAPPTARKPSHPPGSGGGGGGAGRENRRGSRLPLVRSMRRVGAQLRRLWGDRTEPVRGGQHQSVHGARRGRDGITPRDRRGPPQPRPGMAP